MVLGPRILLGQFSTAFQLTFRRARPDGLAAILLPA